MGKGVYNMPFFPAENMKILIILGGWSDSVRGLLTT